MLIVVTCIYRQQMLIVFAGNINADCGDLYLQATHQRSLWRDRPQQALSSRSVGGADSADIVGCSSYIIM